MQPFDYLNTSVKSYGRASKVHGIGLFALFISFNAIPVVLSTLPFSYCVFNKHNGFENKKLVSFTNLKSMKESSLFISLPYERNT